MGYSYKRSGWTVRLTAARDFLPTKDRYATFRETVRPGDRGAKHQCLQFTLFKEIGFAESILQIQIFPDGLVQSWAYEPCMVRVYPKKKLIVIGVFEPSP